MKNKWIFVAEKSEGLTGNEELTLPHIFILAMVMTALREKPAMLPVVSKSYCNKKKLFPIITAKS